MKYVRLIFLTILFSNCAFSQDSLKFESELNIDIRGQHILTHFTDKPIACIDCPSAFIADNPFNHFAIYSGLGYKGTLSDKYTFDVGLMMEERSFSGGNTTLDNLQIFPRITISVEDSIKIGARHLVLNGMGGDFWDEDFDDILRIYNLDFNGLKLRLGLGKFWLGFDVIGDLSQSIGLDFHELYKFSGTFDGNRTRNVLSLEVNELFDAPRGSHPDARDYNINNYTRIELSKNTFLKTQGSVRINSNETSFALGAKILHHT
jgi:hypothetical protein